MSDIVREIVEIECARATEKATKETSIKNIKLLIKKMEFPYQQL